MLADAAAIHPPCVSPRAWLDEGKVKFKSIVSLVAIVGLMKVIYSLSFQRNLAIRRHRSNFDKVARHALFAQIWLWQNLIFTKAPFRIGLLIFALLFAVEVNGAQTAFTQPPAKIYWRRHYRICTGSGVALWVTLKCIKICLVLNYPPLFFYKTI